MKYQVKITFISGRVSTVSLDTKEVGTFGEFVCKLQSAEWANFDDGAINVKQIEAMELIKS